MNIYKNFIEGERDFTDYEDLKKNFKIRIPENFNFAYDVVDYYAEKEPSKRALIWCNDDGEEKIFTFADISRESKRAANVLKRLGIKKGDTVMLILRRRYEFWFLILACHRLGAIAIPATNQLLQKDIEYRTKAAGVKLIITLDDEKIQGEIEKAMPASPLVRGLMTVGKPRGGWLSYHEIAADTPDIFDRPAGDLATKNEDVMLLYFTSGTSGYPKMVQHNFLYPLGHIVTAKYWQNVVDDGVHLTVAETGWAKAVWGKLYGQWLCGSAVLAYDMISFKPHLLLQRMEKYGVTTFCAPPTVYRYMIRQDLRKYNLSKLCYAVTAGEALNPEVYNKFYEQTGIRMFEAYGQTEATVMIGNFPGMTPKPGSMGKPAPGYDVHIVRPDGSDCGPKESGSIIVKLDKGRPFGLFSGYYRDEKLTEAAFEGGIYRTGDTAYIDEDGYIWFIGRDDDVIKTAGYRVSPFEVESILQEHPSVLECAVTGVPDPKRGQAIKATIVLTKDYEASHELELKILEFVKAHTAGYKQPRIIEFVKELPKTISGKIRRVEIREKDSEKSE